ncbi:MAG: MotA/TolQ/ExbB proton channel family protein, partial [Bacteriovoracaceae bacterium]
MDISTVVGLVLAVTAILGSIIYGSPITTFIDIPSVLVVVGGVIATTMIKWPAESLKTLVSVYLKSVFTTQIDPRAIIDEIQRLAETARRESVFALEKIPVEDPFLKKAVTLAADNRPPEVITSILSLEISAMEERHGTGIDMLDGMGADGPAFGMIGT